MKNGKAVAASVFHLWIRITPLEFCLLALLFIFFFFLLQLLLLWNTNFFFIILELGTLLNDFMGYFMTSMMEKVFPKKKMNRRKWKAMEMNFEGYVKNNTHTIPKEVLFLLQR